MSIDQRQIQRRSVDPLQEATSEGVNRKLSAVLNYTKGVINGLDLIKATTTQVNVNPGSFVKDYVTIDYEQTVELSITSLSNGFYYIVAEYVYELVIPVPLAEIKIISTIEYHNDESRYLFLGFLSIVGGYIDELAYADPYDPSVFRKYLLSHNSRDDKQGGSELRGEFYHISAAECAGLCCLTVCTTPDHNQLSDIKGGCIACDEAYHTTEVENIAWSALVAGDIPGWQGSYFYCCGNRIDACRLDSFLDTDISEVVHDHCHNELLDLYPLTVCIPGGPGPGYYHLNETQFDCLTGILTGACALPNACSVDGVLGSCFSLVGHTHDHSGALITGKQGGDGTSQFYHLGCQERCDIDDIYYHILPVPNTDNLDGKPPSCYCVCTHEHDHETLTGHQGGIAGQHYHFTEDAHDDIALWVIDDISVKIPNTQRLGGFLPSAFCLANHTHQHNGAALIASLQGSSEGFHVAQDKHDALRHCGFNAPTAGNALITKNVLASVSGIDHNTDLTCLQGGSATERFHTSSSQKTCLTNYLCDGSSLHNHNACYKKRSCAVAEFVNTTGDTMQAHLAMTNHRVENLGEPSGSADVATKHYTDVYRGAPNHDALLGLQPGCAGACYHITGTSSLDLVGGSDIGYDQHCHNEYYLRCSMDATFAKLSGSTFPGNFSMGDQCIRNLPEPLTSDSIATICITSGLGIPPTGLVRHKSHNAGLSGYTQIDKPVTMPTTLTEGPTVARNMCHYYDSTAVGAVSSMPYLSKTSSTALWSIGGKKTGATAIHTLYGTASGSVLSITTESTDHMVLSNRVKRGSYYYAIIAFEPFPGSAGPFDVYVAKSTSYTGPWATVGSQVERLGNFYISGSQTDELIGHVAYNDQSSVIGFTLNNDSRYVTAGHETPSFLRTRSQVGMVWADDTISLKSLPWTIPTTHKPYTILPCLANGSTIDGFIIYPAVTSSSLAIVSPNKNKTIDIYNASVGSTANVQRTLLPSGVDSNHVTTIMDGFSATALSVVPQVMETFVGYPAPSVSLPDPRFRTPGGSFKVGEVPIEMSSPNAITLIAWDSVIAGFVVGRQLTGSATGTVYPMAMNVTEDTAIMGDVRLAKTSHFYYEKN